MTISVVGTESNFANALTVDIDVPAGTQEFDVLVACISSAEHPHVPTDWVEIEENLVAYDSRWIKAMYHVCDASEPAFYTFTSNSRLAGGIISLRGVDNTTPVEADTAEDSSGNVNVTTIDALSITTTINNDLLFCAAGSVAATGDTTSPTGMTEAWDISTGSPNRSNNTVAYEFFPVAGATGDRTFDCPASPAAMGSLTWAMIPAAQPCDPVHPDPLFIPFKDRLHTLARDFTDKGIARAQSQEFDNLKTIERWAQDYMTLAESPDRCLLFLPFKTHSTFPQPTSASQSFDNLKTLERWAASLLDGSCGCNCITFTPPPERCLLYIPHKSHLIDVDLLDHEALVVAADLEFDNYKTIERWANSWSAGLCSCTAEE